MPIEVQWHNEEKTIIRNDISGSWTWEEFHGGIDKAHDLLNEVDHPVVMINLREITAKNPKGNPLPHYSRAAKQLPDNQVMTINVSIQKPMVQLISNLMTRVFPFMSQEFKIVSTMEEALELAYETLQNTKTPNQ